MILGLTKKPDESKGDIGIGFQIDICLLGSQNSI